MWEMFKDVCEEQACYFVATLNTQTTLATAEAFATCTCSRERVRIQHGAALGIGCRAAQVIDHVPCEVPRDSGSFERLEDVPDLPCPTQATSLV